MTDRKLPSFAVVLVERGQGWLETAASGRFSLTGPALFWLFPNRAHSYAPDEGGWDERWALFEGSFTRDFVRLRIIGERHPVVTLHRLDEVARLFGMLHADESHRARLRVEIGRLRAELRGLAEVAATKRGFALSPRGAPEIAVLAPIVEGAHGAVLAFLADGEAWSSSALAIALAASPRTVQRALDSLAGEGKVQSLGRGRARRWMSPPLPGFPTILLLPGPLPSD